jgi:ArsR family transcriptional regulator, arsenate/arsenite/antimonite-responsive transcriptional repressor
LIDIDVASIEFHIDRCQLEKCMPEARAIITLPVISETLCGPPITEVPLTEADSAALATVFAALGDPVRLRLLSMVAAQGEVCSCHLQEPLGKSQPTISHHTRVLAEAGLIEGDKRGKWIWWRVVPERLAALRRALGDEQDGGPGAR